MSTPTTATATIPPHFHHPPYYAHSHQSYQTGGNHSYRPTGLSHSQSGLSGANPILSTASTASTRLPPPHSYQSTASSGQYSSSSTSNSQQTATAVSTNGVSVSTARTSHDNAANLPSRTDGSYSHTMNSSTRSANGRQSGQNRTRSRKPDWETFYKNGLPKEIIVIDDSPEPEGVQTKTTSTSTTATARPTAKRPPPAASHNHTTTNGNGTRHVAKKRKRDDEVVNGDKAYYYGNSRTPHQNGTSGSGSNSTDRTTSAVHTTAATSLSSNSQYGDYVQTGHKRKRTRQQVASESKRREVEVLGDAYISYQPPPYPPKKAGDVPVRVIQDSQYNKNIKVDDDDGHYIVVPDADLTDRYQMVKLLGQGTFGKVVMAKDRRRGTHVAIKIIRSVQKYRDASRIELRVLATLKANDEQNRNRCIHLRDCFDFRGHICIVMDLLGQSVFDFLKSNQFVPFPNSQIQSFARQLFTSVAFLHDLNLIHTDLKPENILLCDSTYQTFTYNRKIPSSSVSQSRQATQRRVLLDTEIRLIDFGSATFQDEYHSSVVSTRHYRAPEIILGLGWSYPCDIWSIGCILVEFFTGDALFQTHDNLEHLAMMEAVVGGRIDEHLVRQVNKMAQRNAGNPASKYFKRLKLDYPTAETTRASRRFVKAMKYLGDIIPTTNPFLKHFVDLLKQIFVYDPSQRITAKQALQHPWFREPAQPDDGTEAARIRAERYREQLPPMRI